MCETDNFYLWLLKFIGLLGLIAFCLWLIMRPQNPTVTVTDLEILPIDNSSSPPVDENQNGTLSYSIQIQNPSKDTTIQCDDVLLTFLFGQDTAATDGPSSIYLDKGYTYNLRTSNVKVDSRSWKALRSAISRNGTAALRVLFSTKYRFNTIGIKSKHHRAKLEGVATLGKDGKIQGKKKIKLKHSSRKWRVKAYHFS